MLAATELEIHALYRQFTDEAVKAKVFGSPSYIFDGELFWGQDRLEMLDEAIGRAARDPARS